jgi:hypothetical protein
MTAIVVAEQDVAAASEACGPTRTFESGTLP